MCSCGPHTHTQNSPFMSLIHYHMGVVQCVYGKMCVHETLSYTFSPILFTDHHDKHDKPLVCKKNSYLWLFEIDQGKFFQLTTTMQQSFGCFDRMCGLLIQFIFSLNAHLTPLFLIL